MYVISFWFVINLVVVVIMLYDISVKFLSVISRIRKLHNWYKFFGHVGKFLCNSNYYVACYHKSCKTGYYITDFCRCYFPLRVSVVVKKVGRKLPNFDTNTNIFSLNFFSLNYYMKRRFRNNPSLYTL